MTDAQIRALIAQAMSAFSQVTRTTSAGLDDGNAAPPSLRSYEYPVRRMQHAGFRSRPNTGARTLQINPQGRAVNGVTVAEDDPEKGPDDLAAGETSVFGTGDAWGVLRFDDEGNVAIDAASGKDINANGGGAKVATDTTPTNNGSLVAVVAVAGPAFSVTLSFVPPGGAPVAWFAFTATGGTPGTYTLPLTGKVNGGSLHFFAPAP
jgi:hypothetical protein